MPPASSWQCGRAHMQSLTGWVQSITTCNPWKCADTTLYYIKMFVTCCGGLCIRYCSHRSYAAYLGGWSFWSQYHNLKGVVDQLSPLLVRYKMGSLKSLLAQSLLCQSLMVHWGSITTSGGSPKSLRLTAPPHPCGWPGGVARKSPVCLTLDLTKGHWRVSLVLKAKAYVHFWSSQLLGLLLLHDAEWIVLIQHRTCFG